MTAKEKFAELRKSKKSRLIFLGIFLVILIVLAIVFEKLRIMFFGLAILIAAAFGMEVMDYDLDLGKLWETGSISESRVESVKDDEGNTVRLIGSCVKADVNCDNFQTQGDAQSMYDTCAAEIEENNDISDAKSLDIYGLDRDKDGIVCEALPKMAGAQ